MVKTKRVKKVVFLLTVLLFAFIVTGCASMKIPGYFYTENVGQRRGEASNRAWLGLFVFGSSGIEVPTSVQISGGPPISIYGFPPVDEVARANGITQITSVEHYITPGILYLWRDYHTVVTGN